VEEELQTMPTQPALHHSSDASKEMREINLLLEEYRTLRDEVNHRVGGRMQMIGFAGVISALLVASDDWDIGTGNFYIAALVLVIAALWLRGINRAIQRIGKHLRQIEERVNALAPRACGSAEDVLTWETRVERGRSRVRGLPRWTGELGGWYTR
jgi:hypothetical protein